MLRYQYVMAQTTDAQNDYSRTSDTWANQTKRLSQNLEELASVVGGVFINALKPLVSWLNTVITKLTEFATVISNSLGKIFGWKYEDNAKGSTLDDYADSAEDTSAALDDATDSAKEFKQQLRGIDELNNLTSNTDSSGSGSGSGSGTSGAGSSSANGGQWVETESLFDSSLNTLFRLGSYIGDALSDAMESIDWDSIYEKARNFGTGLADFLNGLISPRLFRNLGETIAGALNTALEFLNSFGTTFDWKEFGYSIADGVNSFFKSFNFDLLASTINTWANGLLDTIISFVTTVKWSRLGKKIGECIAKIDFGTPLKKVGKIIWEAINAGRQFYSGLFSAAPIETTITTAILGLKFTGLGTKLANKLTPILNSALSTSAATLTSALSTPIGAAIAAAIGSALIGTLIDQALTEAEIDKFNETIDEHEIAAYGDTIEHLTEHTKELRDNVVSYNEAVRDQLSTKDENIALLENLADKYETLSGKTDLTASEQAEYKQVTEQLVENLPELEEYYDSVTGKLDITTESLKSMIEQKEKELRLEAINDAWLETLKQEVEVQNDLNNTSKNLADAEEELEYWTNLANEEMLKHPNTANLAEYQDEITEAAGKVEDLSAELQLNKESLDSIQEQEDFYSSMYENIGNSAEDAAESSNGVGEAIVDGTVEGISENSYKTSDEVQAMIDNANLLVENAENGTFAAGESYVDSFANGAQSEIDNGAVDSIGENIDAGIAESAKENAESTAEEASTNIFAAWWHEICDIFGIASPAKEMKPLGEYILQGIVEGFTGAFSSFTEAMNNFWNDYVAPWFTSEKWLSLYDTIKTSLQNKWNDAVSWWNSLGIVRWWNNNVAPYFTTDKWNFSGIKDGLSQAFNNAIAGVKQIWNDFAGWLNEKLKFSWDAVKVGSKTIIDGGSITLGQIPTFEAGGYPDSASLFWAGENGVAEMVGTIGGKTAVVSGNEISGISDTINSTSAQEVALLRQQNQLLQALLQKDISVSSTDIGKAARNYAKDYFYRTGNSAYSF